MNISTLAQLETWVASREDNSAAQIVYINALIEQPGTTSLVMTIKRGGNISIIGNTANAGFKNIGLVFREYNNVIVRNLTVREVFYPNDGITVDECHHVWIDHCDLYSQNGAGIGVDTYDGLLDVKNGSHNVTISWNRLHSHKKVNLVGHTDNAASETLDRNIRVTFHHNYYYDNDGRNPSLRWGAAHVYNNYYKDIYDYGIAIRQGAHALIENNIYENVVTPITTNKFDGIGIACERGNVFTACGPNSITQTDCNWWNSSTLPYNYSLTPTADLITLLTSKTGTCSQMTTPNPGPTVSITSPSANATFTAPASIAIAATAADANGTVSKVDFYNGSTLLGTDQTSPYSFTWENVPAGTYQLTAKATDNQGASTTSSSVTVIVNSPALPGTTIQAETACLYEGILNESSNTGFNGTGYINLANAIGSYASWSMNSPSSQSMSLSVRYANGSANNRNMSVTVNGVVQIASIDFVSTSAFTSWSIATAQITLAAGYNTIRLTSLMSEGAPNIDQLTFSATNLTAASCTNPGQAPAVSTTAPSNNSSFCHGTSIALTASASDADGTVSKVEFYSGLTLLGTITSAPYVYNWTNAAAGTYTITAKATDNAGLSNTSAEITVTVNSIPSAPGVNSQVVYCKNANAVELVAVGSNLKWYNVPTGGTGSSAAPFPGTSIESTTDFYVSQTVNNCESERAIIKVTVKPVPPAPTVTSPVTYCQNATAVALTSTVSGTDLKWYTEPLNGTATGTAPTPATNVIGTTHHYVSQTVGGCESPRSDVAVIIQVYPEAVITPDGPTTFIEGGSVLLSANTGTGLSYKWYNGNAQVGTASTYSASASGSYTVEVTNASGCKTTSVAQSVTVSDNQPPAVSFVSPLNNSSYINPATINLGAIASDADGSISVVHFYLGTTLLESDNSAPYSFTWTGVSTGTYILTVKAVDNLGAETISSPLNVTVNANQPSEITITSPTDNGTVNGTDVTIGGTVTDPDGDITLVEYYNGNHLLGSGSSSPFSFVWNNVSEGTYVITVKATDSHGGITTAFVTVTVDEVTGLFSGRSNGIFTSVYPNPTNSSLFIKPSGNIKHVWLVNMFGAKVEEQFDLPSGQEGIIGKDLSDGTYLLMVEYASGKFEVAKIVKLK